MTILNLIVARGGSKRIPKKNLQMINGLSLIGYKAKASPKAVLSTEDSRLMQEGRFYGLEILIRPEALAQDHTPTELVVKSAMENLPRHTAIMLLEPSSPFVSSKTYEAAIEMMIEKDADFIFGHVLYLFKWDWLKTRQDLYDNLTDKCYYVDMPTSEAVDIDTPHDLEHARWLAANGYVDLSWAK